MEHAELKLRSVVLTAKEARVEAQKWVLHEFTGRDKHGLERLGLLGFELERPERWIVPLRHSAGMGGVVGGRSMGSLPGVARHFPDKRSRNCAPPWSGSKRRTV